VAGNITHLLDLDENRVVTVRKKLFHLLDMSACRSFVPKLHTGAAPVMNFARLQGALNRFSIADG